MKANEIKAASLKIEGRVKRSELFKVKCAICGKVTAARLPRAGRYKGDGTFWFPRRHKVNGVDCKGNIEEAEVIYLKGEESKN